MRHFLHQTIVLISVLFGGASFPAFAEVTGQELIQQDCQNPDKRSKYLTDRLETISKEVGLTAEEKAFLGSELLKYDNNRFTLYKKTRDLKKQMEKPGLSAGEYTSLLNKILEAELERGKETINLFNRLESMLSPEKRAKVYISLRSYNNKVAKRIRGNKD